MRYKIISTRVICLLILISTKTNAQNNTVSAKDFLAHMDSIKAAKRNDKSFQLSALRNLRDEPLNEFYKRADSLNLTKPSLTISDELLKELKEKDKGLPYHFLSKADALYTTNPEKLDEVAILMFVGLMRYDYYIGVFPGYAPNGEGWVSTNSFKQEEKLRVELYLQNNIEKYKAILQFAIKYCSENNYTFYKEPKETMMFNKVMQPYKNLLVELDENKASLERKWAMIKEIKLDPKNLENEAKVKEHKTQSSKAFYNKIENDIKQQANLEDIWIKIEEERKKPDSTLLKKYVREFIAITNEKKSLSKNATNFPAEKPEEFISANDTFKVFVRKGYPKAKLQSTSNKEEIYSYYDAVKGINTMKYRVAKMNSVILEYIKKHNWSEAVNLKVFENLRYAESYFDDGYDKTKDLYLTKSEIQQRNKNLRNYLRNLSLSSSEKKKEIIEILGDVNGTLVWEDIKKIKDKYLTEPIENLK